MESHLEIISAEGDRFKCSPKLAQISQTIRDSDLEEEIDLGILEIDGDSLQLILNYCEHHQYIETELYQNTVSNSNFASFIADPWDVELIECLDTEQVLRLLKAANKLAIKPLVELISVKIASVFAGKSIEGYKSMIDMDVTVNKAQESWLKREYTWPVETPNSEQAEDYL